MDELIIDIGDTVVCDRCNGDYTQSDEQGGMLVGTNAYCPECTRKLLLTLRGKKVAPGEYMLMPRTKSFKENVLAVRNGDNTIRITSY